MMTNKRLKTDIIFFQIGQSTINKQMILGITNEGKLFASFATRKGKFETIYSELKMKPQVEYFIAISKSSFANTSEINMYLNGFPETQITMQTQFDVLSGNFYFGSELNLSAFAGTINQALFFQKQLNLDEIKQVYERKIENQIQQLEASQNAKQSSIPQYNAQIQHSMLLNKAHATHFNGLTQEELQLLDQTSQMLNAEFTPVQKFNILVEAVREVIENTKGLEQKCLYLAHNFERAFLTLQMFSPSIQEGIPSKLPFICLHKEISEQQAELPYPIYAIELNRFLRAMEVIGCQIVEKEFIEIGKACKAIKRSKDFGRYFVYNKLLLCIRNAVLTRDEIFELRKRYKANPLQTEEEMHASPEQQEKIEQAKAIGPIALGYFASENLVAGFDTLNGFKDKNAVIEYRPISINYCVLRENMIPFKIEFIFKPFIDRGSALEDGEVSQCFYLNQQLYAPNTMTPDQLEYFNVEFDQEQVIKEMILKFEKEKKILLAIDFKMSSGSVNTLRLVEETLFNDSEFFCHQFKFQ
eukprot:TRINITY_DN3007_c0_g1_i1.p1 TRINITY_DN3007_c0_g1~~TRINITY_DN3007_c0_g1_i1.p1  ORF type:complete len:528 (+),score=102.96 TRINITY_DN3007_c0_g1_i1:295-1878(+)